MGLMGANAQSNKYDLNDDEDVNITDVIALVNYILGQTTPTDNAPCEAVDLGLPSGTKWASCNVGATKPEEYGGYYAWGETEEKNYYDWNTYIHCDGTEDTCHDLGSDISGTQYDVAHVKWGGNWCMPTHEQQQELVENCTKRWITINGVNGFNFTGPNGNCIFLPVAGCRFGSDLYEAVERGFYWSSTQNPDKSNTAYYLLSIHSGDQSGSAISVGAYPSTWRRNGMNIRPVESHNNTEIIDQNEEKGYDLNNDGDVNITDAILLVNYILGNNQEMPSLQLSTNSIYINGDYSSDQRLVKIISGSGRYTVTSSNNYVAFAEIFPESYVTLTIMGLGETTITVYDEESGETATIKVIVKTLPLRPDRGILLAVGQRDTIEFTFDNPDDYKIEISDPSIASVEKNNNLIIVKGISEGYTHLWVSNTKNGTLIRHYYVRVYLYCPDDNHPHMIDLGLPSGTKWACCNVGASIPEGYGGYYAWGETEEKAWNNWDNYDHCTLTHNPWNLIINDLGEDIAGTQYDVAHVKWGESWVMPNNNQIKELIDNCKFEWTKLNGVNGCRFTGLNSCRIFMPAAGYHGQSSEEGGINVVSEGGIGVYWSSTQNYILSNSGGFNTAYNLRFDSNTAHSNSNARINGITVRPVK